MVSLASQKSTLGGLVRIFEELLSPVRALSQITSSGGYVMGTQSISGKPVGSLDVGTITVLTMLWMIVTLIPLLSGTYPN